MRRSRVLLAVFASTGPLWLAGCTERAVSVVDVHVLEVSQSALSIKVGETRDLTARPRDDRGNLLSGRSLTWSSSNQSVATVSPAGQITGVGAGSTVITARSESATANVDVEVRNPAPTLTSLSPDEARAGGDGLEVTLGGSGFVPQSVVRWDGEERTAAFVNGSTLRIVLSTDDLEAPGPVDVAVVNPVPGGGQSATRQFIIDGLVFARMDLSIVTVTPCAVASRVFGEGAGAPTHAYCWGLNSDAQFGDGSTEPSTVPVLAAGGRVLRWASAGRNHVCGIAPDNAAYCWGDNTAGQLGDGTTTNRLTPQRLPGTYHTISASAFHTCAIATDERAYCWGVNNFGQLGDGTMDQRLDPTAVAGGLRFKSISTGGFHTCGIALDDRGYCWGHNGNGRIGDGTTEHRLQPVEVSGGHRFSVLRAGNGYSCGITTGGDAFCWGLNSDGRLGDGTTEDRPVPTLVAGGHRFASLDVGGAHNCAITTDGAAYCWGFNAFGQLGNASNTDSPVPVAVVDGFTFSAIAASNRHSCATTPKRVLYCWGSNASGELGTGGTGDHNRPIRVAHPADSAPGIAAPSAPARRVTAPIR